MPRKTAAAPPDGAPVDPEIAAEQIVAGDSVTVALSFSARCAEVRQADPSGLLHNLTLLPPQEGASEDITQFSMEIQVRGELSPLLRPNGRYAVLISPLD